jgi:putative acetyltransferase
MTNIRSATEADLQDILRLHEVAFGPDEGPVIATLVRELLEDETAAPRLSLLATRAGEAVGHILFTAVQLDGAARPVPAVILSPMSVLPDSRAQGLGGQLIRAGVERLVELGLELVFVLGHPEYYPRHGFVVAGEQGLDAPYPIAPEHASAWMVRELRGGVLGLVQGRVRCAQTLSRAELWGSESQAAEDP